MKFISFILLSFLGLNVMAQNVIIDGIPRDTSFAVYSTYIKEKKKKDYIKIIRPVLPPAVEAIEGIIYSEPKSEEYPDRKLKLNIYRPSGKKIYPVLIMVHGGGWSSGDLSLQIPMAQQIAAKGYVTIPVEYRLSPEALYPAAIIDLKTVVKWVRENASKYGINPNKIAISGCSAGGQLAMLVGMTNGQSFHNGGDNKANVSDEVQLVINIDGTSNFVTEEGLATVQASLEKNKIPASVKWLGGTYHEKKDLWIEASPINHVTEESAPVCFINSSIPRFHDGRDDIIKRLDVYNIYTEVHTLPDTPHPFWLFAPWFDTTVELVCGFLNKQFKN